MPESHRATETHQGEVFLDARGNGRAMRLTWHHEADLVVLSLWRDQICAGTFRLSMGDVNEFIDALVEGLRDAPGVQISAAAVSSPPATPLPTPARAVGAHAAPIPETGEVSATSFPEQSQSGQESFTDWAFGPRENVS